jgi:hypothetical protein
MFGDSERSDWQAFEVQVNRGVGTVMNTWFIFVLITKPRLRRRNQSIITMAYHVDSNFAIEGGHMLVCCKIDKNLTVCSMRVRDGSPYESLRILRISFETREF